MYYTYMVRCEDNSIYTGMTNNLEKRIKDHISKNGAKYTKSHKATRLEVAWRSKDKSLACKLEYQIKNLSKPQKEKLVEGERLSTYLSGIVDCRRYKRLWIGIRIDLEIGLFFFWLWAEVEKNIFICYNENNIW